MQTYIQTYIRPGLGESTCTLSERNVDTLFCSRFTMPFGSPALTGTAMVPASMSQTTFAFAFTLALSVAVQMLPVRDSGYHTANKYSTRRDAQMRAQFSPISPPRRGIWQTISYLCDNMSQRLGDERHSTSGDQLGKYWLLLQRWWDILLTSWKCAWSCSGQGPAD